MNAWRILEALLREGQQQYRGESGWTLKQLTDLTLGNESRVGITGRPARPEGEVIDTDHRFDPGIWRGWMGSLEPALLKAASGGEQHAGRPQGGMTFKTTWGQKVVDRPGKARTDFERLPSAMDTYDVVMQADITDTGKRNKKGEPVMRGTLRRIAYAPAIGSTEERRANLQAMMSGGTATLRRRPQPERPEPPKGQADRNPPAQQVVRVGQNRKASADDETGEPHLDRGGGQASSDFKRRLAAISRKFYGDRED